MYKHSIWFGVFLLAAMISIPSENMLAQVSQSDVALDSLREQFDEDFIVGRRGLLLRLRSFPWQAKYHSTDITANAYYREQLSKLWLRFAAHLLDAGLDPKSEEEDFPCMRWNVMVAIDTSTTEGIEHYRAVETLRLENHRHCEQLQVLRDYQDFCRYFGDFYRDFYQEQFVSFREIEELAEDPELLLSDDRQREVVRMVRKCR